MAKETTSKWPDLPPDDDDGSVAIRRQRRYTIDDLADPRNKKLSIEAVYRLIPPDHLSLPDAHSSAGHRYRCCCCCGHYNRVVCDKSLPLENHRHILFDHSSFNPHCVLISQLNLPLNPTTA